MKQTLGNLQDMQLSSEFKHIMLILDLNKCRLEIVACVKIWEINVKESISALDKSNHDET